MLPCCGYHCATLLHPSIILNHFFSYPTVVSPKEAVATKMSPPTHYPINSTQSTPASLTSPPPAYPAVLVGRTSSESKAKVPPPVPPRGTQKLKRGDSNGKGAHYLRNCVSSIAKLHANTLELSSSYCMSPLTPHFNSIEFRNFFLSHKFKIRSMPQMCARSRYFLEGMRSATSFSDDNRIEYFV